MFGRLGRRGAWGATAVLLCAAMAWPGAAQGDEAPRCSAWRAAGKKHEKIELRTCARTESADAGDEEKAETTAEASDTDAPDDATTSYDVQVRSTHADVLQVRVELVTADGTVEHRDVKLKKGTNALGECKACREHGDVQSFRVVDGARGAAAVAGESGAKEGASKEKDGGDLPRKVTGNMYMEVLARDLRLSDVNAARLKRIAARYFKATRKRLVVTGGTRTPARQAQLVYDKLKHGEDIVALYENKGAATEIRNAHRDALARGASRKATVRAMREVIDSQIARGIYISKHLLSGAVDVRSWNMEGALEKALREAVKVEPGVTMMDEREGAEPHFHLNLK